MSNLERRIAEIRERCGKATEGKWYRCTASGAHEVTHQYVRSHEQLKKGQIDHAICEAWGGTGPRLNDAEFIAHSRQDIPFLLTALEIAVRALDGISNRWNTSAKMAMEAGNALDAIDAAASGKESKG